MANSFDPATSGLMSTISLGQNAIGLIKSNSDLKKANAMVIPQTDWRQQEVYDRMRDRARSLETGAAYAPQQASIAQQGLSAMGAATRTAGGGIGTTIGALSNINRSTGRLMNELYGGMSSEGLQMQNLIAQTAKSMADRALSIQFNEKQQALADATERKQGYQQGLTTALSDMYGSSTLGDITGSLQGLLGGGGNSNQSGGLFGGAEIGLNGQGGTQSGGNSGGSLGNILGTVGQLAPLLLALL